MWLCFGVCLIMAIVWKPEYHMYWTRQDAFTKTIFVQLILGVDLSNFVRSRISVIQKWGVNWQPQKATLLSGISHCTKKYALAEHLAIDEYLSFWKRWVSFRKHIPAKRERYAVKIFMLCEKSRGYLLNFIVYTGVATQYPDLANVLPMEFNKYKFPSIVILSLLPDYLNKSSRTSHCFDFIWHWLLRRHFS